MLEISRAKKSDFSEILSVLNHNLISNKENQNSPELANSGFLIHGFDETDLTNYLANENALVAVAKINHKVIGYVINFVMDDEEKKIFLGKCDFADEVKEKLFQQKVLYHRHIAKLPGYKGVASLLMNEIIKFANRLACENILCQIALKPVHNIVSEKFHKQFGFNHIGKAANPDEPIIYAVFSKEL